MMSKTLMFKTLCLASVFILPAPYAAADNIADCEVLIAERIEDEATDYVSAAALFRR